MLNLNYLAMALAVFVLASQSAGAELSIDTLVTESGLVTGDVPVRTHRNYDPTRKIIVRDVGLDLSGFKERFSEFDVVVV